MDTIDPFAANIPAPTAARPLLGLTILVVEDSRFACEAMRLLCLRSGARIRRADCLRSARRHLQVYRPSVAIVDLGLPDGNGVDLIAELTECQPRVEAILAMSGDGHLEGDALAAGADGFLAKPITSIAMFQECILALLPADRRPTGPREITDEIVVPDKIAYQDDIAHIADVLDDPPDEHALDYVAQFLSGVARSARDEGLEQAAQALATKRALGQPSGSEAAAIAGMIQNRLAQKIAI
ncbi:response regulator [Sulfitobacter sp. MF3-043]|uniref:response regulator n=1 Tax=Sulfitobacter sediminivivens TaxID=3252902 RepID=UPI0036D86282